MWLTAGFVSASLVRIDHPHAALQFLQHIVRKISIDHGAIGFWNTISRVRKLVRQLAVIGEQKQSSRFGFEPANRINARKIRRQQIDRAPLLALRDVGGVNALGFVHEHINSPLALAAAQDDRLVIDRELCPGSWIDQHGKGINDLAVHRNTPLPDHFFDRPPRSDASVGENFLDAFFHGGIVSGSQIASTALHASIEK